MDLEEITRKMFKEGQPKDRIKADLLKLTGSAQRSEAIITEIENSERLPGGFAEIICRYPETGLSAEVSGLGCRGTGDFLIHRSLARVIGSTGAVVDSLQQDDGGTVETDLGYLTAAVDGMHSRLSHFPFLAGFHAARAAVRDVLVMGASPKALLSDIHLANDGDIGKIMDYTAGVSTVSELLNVPLIGGSTLRIGGDMVMGDRLTGCVLSAGTTRTLTARKNARVGDLLVMTEGSGGGTITTTALYNGRPEVLLETLNVRTIRALMELVQDPLLNNIHAMTDITNGGIRGDAYEFGSTADVQIEFNRSRVIELISPGVSEMLAALGIDPLGISTDSILFTIDSAHSDELINFLKVQNVKSSVVGEIKEGRGVFVIDDSGGEAARQIQARFREAPYTPLKSVIDDGELDGERLNKVLDRAMKDSIDKKIQVLEWIKSH
jgi:hydrogenase expression/formation protein